MRAGAELICNAEYYSIYHIVAGIYGNQVGSVVFCQFRQLQEEQDASDAAKGADD